MSEENVEIVRRTLEAFGDRDFEAASYLAPVPQLRGVPAWAIQDSNLGPLPYQRSALTD